MQRLHSPDQVLMGGANEARLLAGDNADMLRRFALDSESVSKVEQEEAVTGCAMALGLVVVRL